MEVAIRPDKQLSWQSPAQAWEAMHGENCMANQPYLDMFSPTAIVGADLSFDASLMLYPTSALSWHV